MSIFRRLYRGETNIDFIGTRKRWYLASAVLLLICILSFVFRGFNYGVEFEGGTQFRIQTSGHSISATEVNDAFPSAEPAQVVGSGNTQTIVVKTEAMSPGEQAKLVSEVANDLGVPKENINVD